MSILQNFAEGLLGSLHPFLQLSRETQRSWFSFFLSLISMFIRYFFFSDLMNTFQVLLPTSAKNWLARCQTPVSSSGTAGAALFSPWLLLLFCHSPACRGCVGGDEPHGTGAGLVLSYSMASSYQGSPGWPSLE